MTQRSIVYIAVFGTLWGFVEATLGNVLHLLHLPFSGSILSAIGLVIILIARVYNPVIGSTLLMSLIAASIKILSFATIKVGPFVAIIMEGLLIELVLIITGPKRFGFLLSGVIMAFYPLIQNIVTKSILFGSSFVPIILDLAKGFSEQFGYSAGWWILGLYLLIPIFIGVGSAYVAWILNKRLLNNTLPDQENRDFEI